MEKDIFLCHSSLDKPWVERLASDIEAEEWNGRKLTVFLDKWDIDIGDNIVARINSALAGSRFVAIVMAPEMIGSAWCEAEFSSVLYQDPTNRLNRLVPLRRRDVHLTTNERLQVPPLLAALNYLDFRADKDYRKSLARLLAKLRGASAPRGGAGRGGRGGRTPDPIVAALPEARDQPDHVPETLISNVLPVRAPPGTVFSAPTTLQSKRDLPQGLSFPPCIVREGHLFTFTNLARPDSPFAALVRREMVAQAGVAEWIVRADRWRWFVELLNDTLRRHLWKQGIGFDKDHDRYYFLPQGTPTGKVFLRWGAGAKRWVVRAPDPGRGGKWIHQAARLRFETLGDRLYLAIEPSWVFTTDGKIPVAKETVGPLTMKWSGKERNGAILRHVLMWSDVMTSGKREAVLEAGDQKLIIGRLPATVQAPIGIVDDRVGVGALLEFTRAELNMATAHAGQFGYVEDASGGEARDFEA